MIQPIYHQCGQKAFRIHRWAQRSVRDLNWLQSWSICIAIFKKYSAMLLYLRTGLLRCRSCPIVEERPDNAPGGSL